MHRPDPLKRAEALHPLSHDHHHGLMFCWKLKQGLKREVEASRIMHYARYFFAQQLEVHFREEETLLFPLLGMDHPDIKRAINEHRTLKHLFFEEENLTAACMKIVVELQAHIRFEERMLFNEIQEKASPHELLSINQQLHTRSGEPDGDWHDPFWQKESKKPE